MIYGSLSDYDTRASWDPSEPVVAYAVDIGATIRVEGYAMKPIIGGLFGFKGSMWGSMNSARFKKSLAYGLSNDPESLCMRVLDPSEEIRVGDILVLREKVSHPKHGTPFIITKAGVQVVDYGGDGSHLGRPLQCHIALDNDAYRTICRVLEAAGLDDIARDIVAPLIVADPPAPSP